MVSALFTSAKTSENLGISSVNLRPPVALRSCPLNSGRFSPGYVGPLLNSWRGLLLTLEMLLKCSVLRNQAFMASTYLMRCSQNGPLGGAPNSPGAYIYIYTVELKAGRRFGGFVYMYIYIYICAVNLLSGPSWGF